MEPIKNKKRELEITPSDFHKKFSLGGRSPRSIKKEVFDSSLKIFNQNKFDKSWSGIKPSSGRYTSKPPSQQKIDRALLDENIKMASEDFSDHCQIRNINEVFYEKFRTKEDAELIRDPSIAIYKNVVHENQKQTIR